MFKQLMAASLTAFLSVFSPACSEPSNTGNVSNGSAFYKSRQVEEKVKQICNDRLRNWPTGYRSRDISTSYGTARVLEFGNSRLPTLILLHAMHMTSVYWQENAADLAQKYHVIAIDYIGDIGFSSLNNTDRFPDTGAKAAGWIDEVLQALKVNKVYMAGASYGGWLTMQYALHYPSKIMKIALMGPMGIAPFPPDFGAGFAFLKAFVCPTDDNRRIFIRWTIGSNSTVRKNCEELLMNGLQKGICVAGFEQLRQEELASLKVPVLLILGKSDKLVGNPEKAALQAQSIPDLTICVLDCGHMISTEKPQETDDLLIRFF